MIFALTMTNKSKFPRHYRLPFPGLKRTKRNIPANHV